METGGERLKITPVPRDDAGNKLEPEERPATEAIPMAIDVALADHTTKPGEMPAVGRMASIVGIESTVNEVARDTATRCELCDHYRHEDWRKHLAMISETPEGSKEIDRMRGALLGEKHPSQITEDDFIAVNLTILREHGICGAHTEISGEVTVVPYYGGCPVDENLFKMRDASAQRIASAGYDKILRLAQGRKE